MDYLNRLINSSGIDFIIKTLNKNSRPHDFTREFYQTCKKLTPILFIPIEKIEEDRTLSNLSYKAHYYFDMKTRANHNKDLV